MRATGWGLAVVRGPSMVPVLRDGDCVLVRRRRQVRPGDVVVARYRSRPDLLVVKRAAQPSESGWLVASDNPFVTAPTGVVDVEGQVVLRYWPLPVRRVRPNARQAS